MPNPIIAVVVAILGPRVVPINNDNDEVNKLAIYYKVYSLGTKKKPYIPVGS
jgi:hypothetical protein